MVMRPGRMSPAITFMRRMRMADYNLMYKKLFNAVTDTIRILQTAQAETEEIYLSQKDAAIILLRPEADGDDDAGKK